MNLPGLPQIIYLTNVMPLCVPNWKYNTKYEKICDFQNVMSHEGHCQGQPEIWYRQSVTHGFSVYKVW